MAKPVILRDLRGVIEALDVLRPYSLTPTAHAAGAQRAAWRNVLRDLRGIEAVLITIDAFKPGILSALESAAIEELQVERGDPPTEITALISRYCRRKEPLR